MSKKNNKLDAWVVIIVAYRRVQNDPTPKNRWTFLTKFINKTLEILLKVFFDKVSDFFINKIFKK